MPKTTQITLEGYAQIGTFVVNGGLVIGAPCYVDAPESEAALPDGSRINFVAKARSGGWHTFVKVEDGENTALLAVHDDYGPKVHDLLGDSRELCELGVDAATMAILDETVREDALFMSENVDRIGLDGLVGERGCCCMSSGGDGTYPLSGVRVNDELLVLVEVDFWSRWEATL